MANGQSFNPEITVRQFEDFEQHFENAHGVIDPENFTTPRFRAQNLLNPSRLSFSRGRGLGKPFQQPPEDTRRPGEATRRITEMAREVLLRNIYMFVKTFSTPHLSMVLLHKGLQTDLMIPS